MVLFLMALAIIIAAFSIYRFIMIIRLLDEISIYDILVLILAVFTIYGR